MRKIFLSFIGLLILSCATFTYTYANDTEMTEMDERVHHTRQFLEVLNVGQELLKDSSSNSYYSFKINELQTQLQTKWKDSSKYPAVEELEKLKQEVERLEQDLIIESVKVFAIPPYSSRRTYTWWKNWPEPGASEYAKKRHTAVQSEIGELVLDWKRNVEGLIRYGINLDISIESERIRMGKDKAFTTLVPDRLFEQRYGFYREIATERQRVAAEVLHYEQELEAFKKVINLRRQMGVKLSGIETVITAAKTAIAKYRDAVVNSAYPEQIKYEKKALEVVNNLKNAATVEQGGTSAIWPGVSFYSTGRFALGGSWQGLLNCEINHTGFYRETGELRSASKNKLQWSFSFNPPDAGRFYMETLDQSWTHTTRRYYYPTKLISEMNKQIQEVTWSILAPGTLVNTYASAMQLSDTTQGNSLPPDKVIAVIKGNPVILAKGEAINPAEMTENWLLLFTENGMPVFPVMVVFETRPEEIVWTKEGLEIRRKEGVGRSVITLPYGAASFPANYSAPWQKVPLDILQQARDILPRVTYYPITTDEFFSLQKDYVKVFSKVSKAVELKSEFCKPGKPYIPLPTVYGFSIYEDIGFKVDSKLSSWLMLTKYGPYQVTEDSLLVYRVPKTRMWERLDLRPVDGEKEWIDKLNKELFPYGDFSRFYETGTYLPAYLMLTPENRERVRAYKNPLELEAGIAFIEPLRMLHAVEPAIGESNLYIDPITGQSYWSRGWRGNRHDVRMRGDVANYQAMQMIGIFGYAKYFGAWDLLEKHWDKFRQAYLSVPARHDWAVPGHDSCDTGFIYSGDMLGDGWRGHHLMVNAASVLGKTEDKALAEYLGSVSLLTAVSLGHPATIPYNQRISNEPWIQADNVIATCRAIDTGLSTLGGEITDKNWTNLYCFSGCIVHDYPIYDGLFTLYPSVGHYQHQQFAKLFTFWLDEKYLVPTNPINSVNLAGTNNYLKYLSWIGTDKKIVADYWRKLFEYYKKRKLHSFEFPHKAINTLPYFIAQGNPIWLSSWDKAKLEDGTYDREKKTAMINITSSRSGILRLVSALSPLEVTVNSKNRTDKEYKYTDSTQELEIPYGIGKQVVSIKLKEDTDTEKSIAPGILKVVSNPKALPVTGNAPQPGDVKITVLTGDLKVTKTAIVDLSTYANMGWYDEKAGDEIGGTHDSGESWELPSGEIVVRGVPFNLIDPNKNNGKSCIVLKGVAKNFFPAEVNNIIVGHRIKRIFFFHGTAWTGGNPETKLIYVLKFRSGKTRELKIKSGNQIGEWKIPPGGFNDKSIAVDSLPDLPDARGSKVWFAKPGTKSEGMGVGGYVYVWTSDVMDAGTTAEGDIQRALDTLESINIISAESSVPMIFAITVELAE